MKSVSQILEGKDIRLGLQPQRCLSLMLLKMMAEKNIGSLMVLEGDKLIGVLSERDYARKVILKGKSSKDTPVEEIMSTHVVCVGLNILSKIVWH